MKIPEKLRILGVDVPTIYEVVLMDESGTLRDGEVDYIRHEIRLRRGMVPAVELDTYIHELLHYICNTLVINLKEKDACRLGRAFAAILIDNGLLKEEGR